MSAPGPEALVAYLEAREGWAFGYGPEPRTHDCVRWAAGAVEAMHGVTPLSAVAASWTTEAGAGRALKRLGGMAEAVGSVLRAIDPTLAGRGDVGMTEGGQLVVFEGETVVGLKEAGGYVRLPRPAALRAWTV